MCNCTNRLLFRIEMATNTVYPGKYCQRIGLSVDDFLHSENASMPLLSNVKKGTVYELDVLRQEHTTIVHHVTRLPSLFSLIRSRSLSLLRTANLCSSHLVRSLFHQSSLCCYTFCGFNSLFGQRYLKHCNQQYAECADIIRSFRLNGQSNSDVEHVIRTISCD